MDSMTTAHLIAWLREFSRQVEAGHSGLSELDAATGDADHGTNLYRGVLSLCSLLDIDPYEVSPGEFFKQVGMKIVDSVGGSSGALYGTIFLRMASAAGLAAQAIDGPTMANALRAAAQGIVDRGRARVGDKTMLDAMDPAAHAFEAAIAGGQEMGAAWQAAAQAARTGAEGTKMMRARRGKSSYVGEKSVGAIDPGAASIALLIASAVRAMDH
jgi:phosphoenolpyruvate---glycerone phosphotransferase subunit DhaL